jgi:hypothetical protein
MWPRKSNPIALPEREHRRSDPHAEERLRFLLGYGVLAPGGSVQPWVLRLVDGAIDLIVHHTCMVPLHDAGHRDLFVSCGAALAQLRLSLRQLGYHERVAIAPDRRRPELVARIALGEPEDANPEAYVLYQALKEPVLVSEDVVQVVDGALLSELAAVCDQERASLHYVDPAIMGFAMRPGPPGPSAPPPSLCHAPPISEVLQTLHPFRFRTFDPDSCAWVDERDMNLSSTVLAVIATERDDADAWLAAGQALSRILLRARVDGVYACVQSLRSIEARAKLAGARGLLESAAQPQLALRLGYPSASRIVRHDTVQLEAVRSVARLGP